MSLLKIIIFTMVASMGVLPVTHSRAETVFFDSLYDVPVMEGLSEVHENGTSFDKAQGRIVHLVAQGDNLSQNQVLAFYGQALPQMGWTQVKEHIFVREQEKLEIFLDKTKASGNFVFSLSPVAR